MYTFHFPFVIFCAGSFKSGISIENSRTFSIVFALACCPNQRIVNAIRLTACNPYLADHYICKCLTKTAVLSRNCHIVRAARLHRRQKQPSTRCFHRRLRSQCLPDRNGFPQFGPLPHTLTFCPLEHHVVLNMDEMTSPSSIVISTGSDSPLRRKGSPLLPLIVCVLR